MKQVKHILCILLAIVMSLGFTTQVFAADIGTSTTTKNDVKEIISENFGYMLDSVLNRAEIYGLQAKNFGNFEILNPVTFNTLDEEIDESTMILHFPIADGTGNICLIYDVIFTEDGYSATIGADFAPLLNSIYQEDITSVVLIQDEHSFYRVQQASVVRSAILGLDLGWLGVDEALSFKALHVFSHGVFAHACGITYCGITRMALESFPILAVHEESVYNYLSGR